ncbi:MoaD/ThiS family protein [uncultured Mycolicibacterium sp.]|uniref:MoaD/ThiS family protein n=1 Tax=uncultured Mycolicibacterium sp. TaxID=2320817 RepID=UPI00262B0340|nr:MoaD/ThiS family protein [uncultured Mycolicibacterium sp.]
MSSETRHADPAGAVEVTVRFFAAAAAAAGTDERVLTVPAGTTLAGLVEVLAASGPELARVLPRCSYLCDEVAARDPDRPLRPGQTVDVLPPFAGG